LHQHQENAASSWFQITNQFTGGGGSVNAGPTAIAANDGLRLGLLGSTVNFQNGIAMLYQQENRPLLISSNANTTVASPLATLERIRLMAYNTPTLLPSGTYGVYLPDPTSIPANPNITRMSISHNPSNPVTRPLSLLHLGYNTGAVGAGTVDGWRAWMDVGMFTSNGTDNVYIGLKQEPGLAGDRNDAVINWGDNQVTGIPPSGPDNLRFIFTSTTTGTGGTLPATGFNGLEGMRLTPTASTGVFTGIGGEPTGSNPYFGGVNPTNTLEVNSWGLVTTPGGSSGLRFTDLNTSSPTITNPGNGILAVDAEGDVIYVDAPTGIGNYCTDTDNLLTGDYEIPMNNFNIYYSGQGFPTTNAIGLGYNCSAPMPAKFNVLQENTTVATVNTIAGSFINRDFVAGGGPGSLRRIGVSGISDKLQGSNALNIGGDFIARNSPNNFGVRGTAGNTTLITGINYGGYFSATSLNSATNYGLYAEANSATSSNYAIYGRSLPGTGATPPSGPNYAGYFDGDVYISGSFGPSDLNLKENIDSLENALSIINQLKPKTFTYKNVSFPSMNLPNGLQYGLIAQDVETVLPELVNENIHPARYDSTGTEISPAVNFKGLEYQQLIPLLLKGIQEQQRTISDLNTRLTNLENCISNLNLCDGSHAASPSTNDATSSQQVNLKDLQAVILDQNVPNPFAEQTTITYTLIENTQKAQMLFYNAAGKLIHSVELATKSGKGELNVFGNDLSNGIYTYTLVVDGKIIDTKRMVKNK
jgi:hypothetical protein